ncbi:putative spermidine/putrescine transport system ATP-binding protein [Oceanisphaera litoralis]|uniref:ABC transporter ATP-binding protein n=1 Tax=Oceanisphaera litoralis TaxID=225144 RepID=UPI00195E2153|nr:ABC transporter ATP-binding protein [Oceanisphaera litoralis]MBM7456115.1 putative spermidine/putrescine transport system ATP-binding protein [Oceanisphaera litoralis]
MSNHEHGVSIRLENCRKTFADGTLALQPLDLTINAGETLVLLGPSGCGKTTTLRMIAGLEFPDEGGRILFGDEDVTRQPIEKRKVGMVFQSYALFPNMTVAENVGYGLKVQKVNVADIKRRVAEMLEMMELGALAHRRISQLSGGQRQRVALARAIITSPRVLLLDEPLTALDALLRERLRADINSLLRKLGITAIYVTHDQDEAMALGDRIVVMEQGRVSQIGSPREIYFTPKNDFVADFIGQINVFEGQIRDRRMQLPGGSLPDVALADGFGRIHCRPEDIVLTEAGSGQLTGVVQQTQFIGDRTRVWVAGAGQQPVLVDGDGRTHFTQGQPVGLQIKPDQMILLDQQGVRAA